MAQNLSEIPPTIKRNINYFVLFKTTDNTLLSYIFRTFGLAPKEKTMKIYKYATEKPENFLIIGTLTNNPNEVFRHNFNEFLNLNHF